SGADPVWLVGCALGQVLVFTGYAGVLRRAIAVDGGPPVHVGFSVRLALASFAATQLFSLAGVAGLAMVYWTLRRLGRERQDAAVALIGLNTCVYLVFAAIGWIAAAAALLTGQAGPGMTVPWLIGIPIVMVAAWWFTAPERIERWTAPTPGTFRRALATGVAAAGWARRRVSIHEERRILAWAACYWVGDIVSLGAALQAFGSRPPLVALVAAYTTGYLVQSLPLPFVAGAGVDAATTFLLHAVGVPLEVALVAVVAHRVFAFWIPIVPGCMFAFSLPRAATLARLPDPDVGQTTLAFGDRAQSARLASGERG
ncbi:MAG TPA: lysylphosphatidylglycerol synthase domain-containing protein, partial [Ilumatobacter sp.]